MAIGHDAFTGVYGGIGKGTSAGSGSNVSIGYETTYTDTYAADRQGSVLEEHKV